MQKIVLDTNCLLMSIPKNSPYRCVWDAFLDGTLILCVSNEILIEYQEIIAQKINPRIADNIIYTMLGRSNLLQVTPYYRFGLIQSDPDDNKFVDCAITAGASFLVSNDSHFNVVKKIPFPRLNVIRLETYVLLLKVRPYNFPDEDTPMLLNEDMTEYAGKKSESDC